MWSDERRDLCGLLRPSARGMFQQTSELRMMLLQIRGGDERIRVRIVGGRGGRIRALVVGDGVRAWTSAIGAHALVLRLALLLRLRLSLSLRLGLSLSLSLHLSLRLSHPRRLNLRLGLRLSLGLGLSGMRLLELLHHPRLHPLHPNIGVHTHHRHVRIRLLRWLRRVERHLRVAVRKPERAGVHVRVRAGREHARHLPLLRMVVRARLVRHSEKSRIRA